MLGDALKFLRIYSVGFPVIQDLHIFETFMMKHVLNLRTINWREKIKSN